MARVPFPLEDGRCNKNCPTRQKKSTGEVIAANLAVINGRNGYGKAFARDPLFPEEGKSNPEEGKYNQGYPPRLKQSSKG